MITYHVVVTFYWDTDGVLMTGEGVEAPSAEPARRRAQALAAIHADALAISRTGGPATGEFQRGEMIAEFGGVDQRLDLADRVPPGFLPLAVAIRDDDRAPCACAQPDKPRSTRRSLPRKVDT